MDAQPCMITQITFNTIILLFQEGEGTRVFHCTGQVRLLHRESLIFPSTFSLYILPLPSPSTFSLYHLPLQSPSTISLHHLPLPSPSTFSLYLLPLPSPSDSSPRLGEYISFTMVYKNLKDSLTKFYT